MKGWRGFLLHSQMQPTEQCVFNGPFLSYQVIFSWQIIFLFWKNKMCYLMIMIWITCDVDKSNEVYLLDHRKIKEMICSTHDRLGLQYTCMRLTIFFSLSQDTCWNQLKKLTKFGDIWFLTNILVSLSLYCYMYITFCLFLQNIMKKEVIGVSHNCQFTNEIMVSVHFRLSLLWN